VDVHAERRQTVAILAALAVAIALVRLAFIRDLPDWDVATYTLIGREMLHGRQLYAGVWDMKPPAIFVAYAGALFVTGEHVAAAQYLLGAATSITAMLAIYFAVAKLWDRQVALWASALWAAVCAQPAIEANATNTEALINCALALGLAAYVCTTRWPGAIFAGVCFAIATTAKHVAVVPAIAIVMFLDRRRPRMLIALAMIPALWLTLWAYAGLTGRARLFFDTAFVYPSYYAARGFHPPRVFPSFVVEFIPVLALAAIGIVQPRRRALPIALLLATFLAVAMPGQFHAHYYQLWLLPLVLAGGAGAAVLWVQKRLIVRVVAPIALVGLIVLQLHWLLLSPRDRLAAQHPASFVLQVVDEAEKIRRVLQPNETMFAWCDEPQLYLLANRRPPTMGLWRMHMTEGPMRESLTSATCDELHHRPPDLIVTWAGQIGYEDHPIQRFIELDYENFPDDRSHFPLSLYARRGSDLARRVATPILAPDAR
jgi:hypothetical protein